MLQCLSRIYVPAELSLSSLCDSEKDFYPVLKDITVRTSVGARATR